jgi:hypothetical protein
MDGGHYLGAQSGMQSIRGEVVALDKTLFLFKYVKTEGPKVSRHRNCPKRWANYFWFLMMLMAPLRSRIA